MPGRIASLSAAVGAAVTRGQTLVTLEAMKMEHALVAPYDGAVTEVRCAVGDQVTEGALLVRLAAPG
jgi:3-methylcrotonyl-CoA carboxylase alpha subunit